MSNFLVCLMLLGIMRATNQEFVSARQDALMVAVALAFFLDVFRLIHHFVWRDSR